MVSGVNKIMVSKLFLRGSFGRLLTEIRNAVRGTQVGYFYAGGVRRPNFAAS